MNPKKLLETPTNYENSNPSEKHFALVWSPTCCQPATPVFCIVLRRQPENKLTPYCVHQYNFTDGGGYHNGDYFEDADSAKKRFAERTSDALKQTAKCGGYVSSHIPPDSKEAKLFKEMEERDHRLTHHNTLLIETLVRLRTIIGSIKLPYEEE